MTQQHVDSTGRVIRVGDIVASNDRDFHPPQAERCGIVYKLDAMVRFIEATMTRNDPLFGHWYAWHAYSVDCTVIGRVDDQSLLNLTDEET